MRSDTAVATLDSSYGANKKTLRDQGVLGEMQLRKRDAGGESALRIGSRKRVSANWMRKRDCVYANNQTINGERRFGVFCLRWFVSS